MPIDLRSDTVTRPSPAMRRAMAEAEVGDDVLDADPTTRRLEERAAALLGKGDALFFPSGTQTNQTAVWFNTQRGTELLVEANAHVVHHEIAAVAGLAGAQIRPVATPDGVLTAELVRVDQARRIQEAVSGSTFCPAKVSSVPRKFTWMSCSRSLAPSTPTWPRFRPICKHVCLRLILAWMPFC